MLTDLAPPPYIPNPLAVSLLAELFGAWPPSEGWIAAPSEGWAAALPPVAKRRGRPRTATQRPPRLGWTPASAAAALRAFVAAHGHLPVTWQWRRAAEHAIPPPAYVRREWGSLTHCCAVLGLTRNPPPQSNQHGHGRAY